MDTFYREAFEAANVKPDGPSTFAWDPALLVVSALKALPEGATAEQLKLNTRRPAGFWRHQRRLRLQAGSAARA